MEDTMLEAAGDKERVHVLSVARTFKRSWIELADALSNVFERDLWKRWGFDNFDAYCQKELHIKKNTVAKLLGSFRFLNSNAPKLIERTRREPDAPVPSLKAVDFVIKAAEKGAANKNAMKEIRQAAFEEGMDAPRLVKRFKEVAFPVTASEKNDRLRQQLVNSARRLANLIAEPEAPVPHAIAVSLEEALGRLLESLDT